MWEYLAPEYPAIVDVENEPSIRECLSSFERDRVTNLLDEIRSFIMNSKPLHALFALDELMKIMKLED